MKVLNQLVNAVKTKLMNLMKQFHYLKDRCRKASEQFQNFNIFLESIALVLPDLAQFYHKSNWELDLPALRRTLPLPFAFDRVN